MWVYDPARPTYQLIFGVSELKKSLMFGYNSTRTLTSNSRTSATRHTYIYIHIYICMPFIRNSSCLTWQCKSPSNIVLSLIFYNTCEYKHVAEEMKTEWNNVFEGLKYVHLSCRNAIALQYYGRKSARKTIRDSNCPTYAIGHFLSFMGQDT